MMFRRVPWNAKADAGGGMFHLFWQSVDAHAAGFGTGLWWGQ